MEKKINELHNKIDTVNAKLNRMCDKFNKAMVIFNSINVELNKLNKENQMLSKEFIIEEEEKGTYAGMRFSDESIQKILDFANDKDIPNVLDKSDFHTTLLYSRKNLPNYKPLGDLEPTLIAHPTSFEVWVSPANEFKDDDTSCLVLRFKCQEQEDRFNKLMDEHEATYDYDEYKPHVSISYDVGPDFDITTLDASTIGELELINEYKEELTNDKSYLK